MGFSVTSFASPDIQKIGCKSTLQPVIEEIPNPSGSITKDIYLTAVINGLVETLSDEFGVSGDKIRKIMEQDTILKPKLLNLALAITKSRFQMLLSIHKMTQDKENHQPIRTEVIEDQKFELLKKLGDFENELSPSGEGPTYLAYDLKRKKNVILKSYQQQAEPPFTEEVIRLSHQLARFRTRAFQIARENGVRVPEIYETLESNDGIAHQVIEYIPGLSSGVVEGMKNNGEIDPEAEAAFGLYAQFKFVQTLFEIGDLVSAPDESGYTRPFLPFLYNWVLDVNSFEWVMIDPS